MSKKTGGKGRTKGGKAGRKLLDLPTKTVKAGDARSIKGGAIGTARKPIFRDKM